MSGKEAACLKVFLRELATTPRRVLLLRYADGLTPCEIGATLDLSTEQVRSILASVLQQARQRLAERGLQPTGWSFLGGMGSSARPSSTG
jgi:DNA-directed RNA polymerase specialized sigma24 family protein